MKRLKDGLGIYSLKEEDAEELKTLFSACPEISGSWISAKESLKNSILRNHLTPKIILWDKRAAVILVKTEPLIRATNKLKAFGGIYNALVIGLNGGKSWISMDKSADEIFATMN